MTPLISLQNVTVKFQDKIALDDVSLEVVPNEMLSVIGPNGGGKSTLIKSMMGLLPINKGTITKNDTLKIGYVPQNFMVPTHLPLRVKDFLVTINQSLPLDLFSTLGLKHIWNNPIQSLSGGERQRVLIANALNNHPNLLIMDEPMQGLDIDSEHTLYEFIVQLPQLLNTAIVIISHDIHWVMKGSHRVVCINKQVCCHGKPIDVKDNPNFLALYKSHFEFYQHEHQTHECESAHFMEKN